MRKWINKKIRDKPRLNNVRTPQKIDQVRKVVKKNPRLSQRRIAAITETKRITNQAIMKSNLALHPYKIQMTHSLDEKDYENRLIFGVLMMERFTSFNKIIFSEEAHFHLEGVVKKQNFRNWSE